MLAPAGWGPQVQGRDWRALAALPWITTPEAWAHHRLRVVSGVSPVQATPKGEYSDIGTSAQGLKP